MAEFYFDSKIQFIKNDLGLKDEQLPILNVERDYNDDNLRYVLYVVLPQLNAEPKSHDSSDLPFDSIEICYDKNGINMEKLEKADIQQQSGASNGGKVEIYFKREDFISSYCRNLPIKDVENQITDAEPPTMTMGGYRINLVTSDGFRSGAKNSKDDDLSGLGKITLYRKEEPKKTTVIYFAVNFGFKRKIMYYVKKDKIVFTGRNICEKIPVKILFDRAEYPCLREHLRGESLSVMLQFTDRKKAVIKADRYSRYKGYKIYVTFDTGYRPSDPNDKFPYSEIGKFYMLQCEENYTIDTENKEFKRQADVLFCPYCHRVLKSKYVKYGSNCQMLASDVPKTKIKINGIGGKGAAKGLVWCEEDMRNLISTTFNRSLPKDYLLRKNFKLAIIGSGRSGKTTYISRVLNITGSNSISIDAEILNRGIGKKSDKRGVCSLKHYEIKQIVRDNEEFNDSLNAWHNSNGPKEFYDKYVYDLKECKFPKATNKSSGNQDGTDDTLKYPFILDVNNKNYVSVYDIAGEDVEQDRDRLKKLLSNSAHGIFYLINGEMDQTGAQKVQNSVRALLELFAEEIADKKRDAYPPIAVVVSKFDRLESQFEENCQCLRSDTRDMLENHYEGSTLERSINMSSAEVEAFLNSKGLNPFIGNEELNIKYFAVSSFSAKDAIFHKESRGTEQNYLKFLSAPKRAELPFIWMLRQFGCII